MKKKTFSLILPCSWVFCFPTIPRNHFDKSIKIIEKIKRVPWSVFLTHTEFKFQKGNKFSIRAPCSRKCHFGTCSGKKTPSRPHAKLARVGLEGEQDKKIGEDCWLAGGSEDKSVVSLELYVHWGRTQTDKKTSLRKVWNYAIVFDFQPCFCFSVWIFVWILRLQFVSLLHVIGALYLCIFVQFWRKQMFCRKKDVLELFLLIDFLVPFIYKLKKKMENMIVTFSFIVLSFSRDWVRRLESQKRAVSSNTANSSITPMQAASQKATVAVRPHSSSILWLYHWPHIMGQVSTPSQS